MPNETERELLWELFRMGLIVPSRVGPNKVRIDVTDKGLRILEGLRYVGRAEAYLEGVMERAWDLLPQDIREAAGENPGP